MANTFFDQLGNYYETITDIETPPDGHAVAPKRPGMGYTWDGSQWVYAPPPPPTQAELDEAANALVQKVFEQQKDATRAIGEVLAEVIFRVSNGSVPQGVSEVQARQWVKNTFLEKYRALLE